MHRVRTVLILLAVVTWCCSIAHGEPAIAGAVHEVKLPDGLTVLTLETHDAPVACTYVYYKVGSRNETTGSTGISHQIEHMMFKGTLKKFPNPGYIDLLIGRHGGVNNAETTTDYTDYFLLVPSAQLDLALQVEADRMTQAAMNPQQLIAEKRVVLSELEGDENQNVDFLYNNMRATAYQDHPYHYPVIGSKWDVQHFTREQVYEYYRNHYCPNNAILVVVGDFNTEAILNRIRALWKDVQSHTVTKTVTDPEPKQLGERRIVVRRAGNTSYLDVAYHIPNVNSPDMPALDVLSTVLTTGRSSRLYKRLVESQLAASVDSGAADGMDPELFEFSVTARSGVPTADIERSLYAELDEMKLSPVDSRELQKAKNETRASFIFGQEGVQAKAARIGYFEMLTGDWKNIDRYMQRVNAVTASDLQRVCAKYLAVENRTVAVFEPNGEKADPSADSGSSGHSAHYRFRRGGAPRTDVAVVSGFVRASAAHSVFSTKLANGVTVVVQEDHSNPTVTMAGFIRAGSEQDFEGKFGAASLLAGMLTRGTASRTSQQIAEAVDFVGASVAISAHRERINVNAALLASDYPQIVAILADCIQHPSFAEVELAKLRGETLTSIREADNDTALRASRRLYEMIYRDDPAFAHDVTGSAQSVNSITPDDLRNYYSSYVRPENLTLIVVGDINAAEATAIVSKEFSDWHPATVETRSSARSVETGGAAGTQSVESIVMSDKSQDDVAMGMVGISRTAKDYEAAALMNLILGGDEFVGRVGKRVRDTEGLAYYAYTAFTPALRRGPWVFRAGVNPANVVKALASTRDEIGKMAAHGVTQSELDWAKDNTIGSLQLSLETSAGIAAQLEEQAFYHLPSDYVQRFPEMVRRISRSEVNAAAARYLLPNSLMTVVAGPPVPGLGAASGSIHK